MSHQANGAGMPRRCYSYERVSFGTQAKGTGIHRQADFAQEIATENGWLLDDTLRFTDKGRSGFHGRNLAPTAALTRFLELVQRSRITPGSVLIIENIDRLSRQDVDIAYDIFRGIIKSGVWIATKTPKRIYRREGNSFMDLMEPIWLMYLAHQESLKKSERISYVWKEHREKAHGEPSPHQAIPPRWIDRKDGKYILNPERAALVRRIVQMSLNGTGYGQIAAILEREKHEPFMSQGWNTEYIRRILKERAVMGEYQPRRYTERGRIKEGKPIQNYYPAVIDEEEWLRVQAGINKRNKRRGRPPTRTYNLFTGLIRDADSRKSLSVTSCIYKGKKYPYLVARGARKGRIPYDAFERCILNTLSMLRPQDVMEPAVEQSQREERIAALTARMVALDHRKEQLTKAAADPDQDATPLLPVLLQVSQDYKDTAAELQSLKMESVTGRGEALTEAQTLTELRDRTSGEEREELDRRIKAALPTVVTEIWTRVQKIDRLAQITHIQIYLRNGAKRYVQLLPVRHRVNMAPADWSDVDFRAGA